MRIGLQLVWWWWSRFECWWGPLFLVGNNCWGAGVFQHAPLPAGAAAIYSTTATSTEASISREREGLTRRERVAWGSFELGIDHISWYDGRITTTSSSSSTAVAPSREQRWVWGWWGPRSGCLRSQLPAPPSSGGTIPPPNEPVGR